MTAGGRIVKRAFDVSAAALLLAVTAPLLAAIAALIRITMGRPVLFSQERPGLHGRAFVLRKFRTMTGAADPTTGALLEDGLRLTPLGLALRQSSLDELPQLWNILRGDMSFVGPRPLLMEYLELYSDDQRRRHEVRPGLTGWAQINGRNSVLWEDRLAMDTWYVDHCSLRLDLRILVATVRKVMTRDGIAAAGEATMPRFTGSRR